MMIIISFIAYYIETFRLQLKMVKEEFIMYLLMNKETRRLQPYILVKEVTKEVTNHFYRYIILKLCLSRVLWIKFRD